MPLRLSRSWMAGLLILLAAWQLVLAVPPGNERAGDRLQIVLPLVGGACAAAGGDLGDYALRFAGLMAVVHGLKNSLGSAPINQRPKGGGRGFPSGHAAASAYGASALLRTCLAAVPGAGPVLVLAAGFVAGSRVEARRHDLFQTLVGAAAGVGFDRGLRSAAGRRRLARAARRLAQAAFAAAQAARLVVSRSARAAAARPEASTQAAGAVASSAR